MIETKPKKDRFLLVGVHNADPESMERSLKELAQLVDTAGGLCAGTVTQSLDHPHPATYIGSGKLSELRDLLYETGADGIVCDDELSPAQMENLEAQLNTAVLDRTMIILDIFAARAKSSEGKIQVELAQLRYRAIRLAGMRRSLSRLGGGIGTRGPGEKKLEIDRRLVHQRIGQLKTELEEVKRHRELTRKQRIRNHVFVAAIVGYTNAGKSTLLNSLTGAGVFAENRLFATLDPTSRMLELGLGLSIMLTDTVGFINKLPHQLIDAFRSTLEEAKYSDLILHVVDASNPYRDSQMDTVYKTLRELGIGGKPVITLMNKQDLVYADDLFFRDPNADQTLGISACTGQGLDALKAILSVSARKGKTAVQKLIPYRAASILGQIRSQGQITREEYRDDGILISAFIPASLASGLDDFPDIGSADIQKGEL